MDRRGFVKGTVAGMAGLATPLLNSRPFSVGRTPPRARIDGARLSLENAFVRRVLEKKNDVWRTISLSRADGTDEVALQSDEFQIILLDGTKLKLGDYQIRGEPVVREDNR